MDGTPVIDGRRANCNLASLGLQRSKPSTPNHGFNIYSPSLFLRVFVYICLHDLCKLQQEKKRIILS